MSKNESKPKEKASIEEIEEMAARGEDVSRFFSGKPQWHPGFDKLERVKRDIQRVNVDFAQPMLQELDAICEDINVPRQSLIKTMVRREMDRYLSNKKKRKAT
jgi:hypothetical protein